MFVVLYKGDEQKKTFALYEHNDPHMQILDRIAPYPAHVNRIHSMKKKSVSKTTHFAIAFGDRFM